MRKLFAVTLTFVLVGLVPAGTASANIGVYHYARGTIIVQNDSYADTAHSPYLNSRLAYIRGLGIPNLGLPQQPCIKGYPCVTVTFRNYGATGWSGLTISAWSCGGSTLCSYNPGDPRTWTRVQYNTYYAENWVGWHEDVCHELGHALFDLNHAGGATCMQAYVMEKYITYSPTEVVEIKAKFAALPR